MSDDKKIMELDGFDTIIWYYDHNGVRQSMRLQDTQSFEGAHNALDTAEDYFNRLKQLHDTNSTKETTTEGDAVV